MSKAMNLVLRYFFTYLNFIFLEKKLVYNYLCYYYQVEEKNLQNLFPLSPPHIYVLNIQPLRDILLFLNQKEKVSYYLIIDPKLQVQLYCFLAGSPFIKKITHLQGYTLEICAILDDFRCILYPNVYIYCNSLGFFHNIYQEMINQFQQNQNKESKIQILNMQRQSPHHISCQNDSQIDIQLFQSNQDWQNLNVPNQRKQSQLTKDGVSYGKKINRYFWTTQEEEHLLSLYEENGPSWSMIVSHFENKTQNCIKNKFNSCFRRAVKILDEHEKKVLRKLGRGINNKIVGVMLEISSQARELIIKQKLTVNRDSLLFKFRNLFLRLCFKSYEFTPEDLTSFSNLIKGLNTKMRCFGAFKRKYVKGWKLTESNILTICQFDQICVQQDQLLKKKIQTSQKTQQLPEQNQQIKQKQKMDLSTLKEEKVPETNPLGWKSQIVNQNCYNPNYQTNFNIGYPTLSVVQNNEYPIISYPFPFPYMFILPEQDRNMKLFGNNSTSVKNEQKIENIIITFHGKDLLK